MGRRAPRAVRAQSYTPLAQPVEGLSSRANAEIATLQHRHPDIEVRRALVGYRRSVRRPGRWPQYDADCSTVDDDLCVQRSMLDLAIRLLPMPAKSELQRLVTPLDEELLRRTLPYPGDTGVPGWHAGWWSRRIRP